jgi:hypothetical protein
MSILNVNKEITEKVKTKLSPDKIFSVYETSKYQTTPEEKEVLQMILKHFELGDMTMQKPRVEFNDMSVLTRMMYDQISFNTYQPNNGDGLEGDILNNWKSNAIRPTVRNKAISIAAHATARLIFPKVFAYDSGNTEQRDAATVMGDLMEWAADKSDYSHYSLLRVLTALTDPASIGYTEYCETYRIVKTEKINGKWKTKRILDDTLSGFQDYVVPCNELYIENPFEPDIQKQGWLIWRKVISYSLAEAKYKDKYDNFKHVFPGVQLIYNDANNTFYQVYDANLRQDSVEEIIYWNRTLDLKIILNNGVMLTDSDEPNPRIDKKYPFDKFYYEMISPKFFYGKSLAFKLQSDARIINDLYQMVIDGTYLSIMPPMINAGGESITSDVIVPGVVTTFENPSSTLTPVQTANNLTSGINTLTQVESSLAESSIEPQQQGASAEGTQTAYEISRLEQNANTVLGLFLKMIAQHVKEYGKLRLSDIIQYMTIADVDKLEASGEMVYKTFLIGDKNTSGGSKTRKIAFEGELKDEYTDDELLKESYKTLESEDKFENTELYRVNPGKFRELVFELSITPDVLNPKSEDLEKAYGLEAYDRMITNPMANQEEAFRLMLGLYDQTKKDPDKFIMQADPNATVLNLPGMPKMNPAMGGAAPAGSQKQTVLPQIAGSSKVA